MKHGIATIALVCLALVPASQNLVSAAESIETEADDPFAELKPRLFRVPNTVDAEQDGELSTEEVLRAPERLLTLDTNGDGMLDHDEVGAYKPQLPLVRWHLIFNLIDINGDAEISADEIAAASLSLQRLDKNKDWHLDRIELALGGNPDIPIIRTVGSAIDRWLKFRAYSDELEGPILPGTDPREFRAYSLIHDASDFGEVQKVERTYLLDEKGNIAHEWPASGNHPEATVAYLLENGLLLRTYSENHWVDDKPFPVGSHSSIELVDWDGNVVWNFKMSEPAKYSFHHDVEYMPNGNILAIRYTAFSPFEMEAMGWDSSLSTKSIKRLHKDGKGLVWMDAILELKPNLEDGSTEIVWQWNTWDHVVQDEFPDKRNYGDTTDPSRIDLNYLNLDNDIPFNAGQMHHVNTVDYNADLDLIMISSAAYGEMWIIDHSTTWEEAAGSTGGRYGKGGDLLYRWGNDHAFGKGTRSDADLFWQHDTQWIPAGLPGAGNMLVYNNGTRRTLDDQYMPEEMGMLPDSYSNMLEVKLPFDRESGFDWSKEAEIVWSWEAPNRADYFSPFMSGLERLPNGNTIFERAYDKQITEVTPEGEVVLDYSPPGWGRLHRIYKYAPDYPGLRFERDE